MGQKGKDLTTKDLDATKKKLQDVEAKLKMALSDKQAALQARAHTASRACRCLPSTSHAPCCTQPHSADPHSGRAAALIRRQPENAVAADGWVWLGRTRCCHHQSHSVMLTAVCGCCCCSQDKANLERQLKQLNSKSTLLEKNLEKKDAQVSSCLYPLLCGLAGARHACAGGPASLLLLATCSTVCLTRSTMLCMCMPGCLPA